MWKKPESDGGSPLVGYTVEKKSVEKNNWVPCASGRIISTLYSRAHVVYTELPRLTG